MVSLLGPNGQPISSKDFQNKKGTPPKTGESFGSWAGRDREFLSLPGGGIVQFDLSKLEIEDFRQMRDHYQINSSLAVLSFMQHQSDWHIECEDKKIADSCEEQIRNNWNVLNRGLSQANWAGYSPLVLNYENNMETRFIDLTKIKDLVPEECNIVWKEVKGWAPPGKMGPTLKVYDGFKQWGQPYPVPVDNSLWYPLLMENGDYGGRKLLRPAFTSWFFSILVHLFANRYFERFGEPVPIGRAPYDEDLDVDGKQVRGNQFMLDTISKLRSRSVVVLPNDKSYDDNGRPMFDYDLEYLESQMRGADFERYMTRLDEEMSIGLFTPILLLRTADVGSYNLGVGHMQMYLWMLNAMNDDRKFYIDKYLLSKMVNFNFSPKAPRARIVFRKMGNSNIEMIGALLQTLVGAGKATVDLEELGTLAGLTVKEVKETLADPTTEPDPADPNADPNADPKATPKDRITTSYTVRDALNAVGKEIVARVAPQVANAFKDGTFGADTALSMGYKRKMESVLKDAAFAFPITACNELYERMDAWMTDVKALGQDSFGTPETFVSLFSSVLNNEFDRLFNAA